MKKVLLNLFLFASITAILISCEGATTEPVGSVVKEVNIVEPANATNLILSADFATQPVTTIKWSGADFGYSAAVKYSLQIALASDADYANSKIINLGSFHESSNLVHEFPLLHKNLNLILADLGGIIANSVNFKMKIVGSPDVQLTDPTDPAAYPNALFANSQEITFSASIYDKFDETVKIYVPGNFGSTSTYADWNVNLAGTSNSPVIYTPLNDGKYSGFVWMNNATPQFKFANPDATNLNLKGFNELTSNAAGLMIGTIKDVSDINDPSNIAISAGNANFTGAGTYYITTDLIQNTYSIIKRKFSVIGQATGNQPKVLDFVTDPTSPYYRMYINTNVNLAAGFFKISLKTSGFAAAADNFGTLTAGVNQVLAITPNSTSTINNKLSIGGGFYNNQNPGNYTVVLDTKNSANYNLRVIPN
jgi:hypothetical protein